MDGCHHYDKTAEVQERIIEETYFACEKLGVYLEGTLLKPSMTCCGAECPDKVTPKDVARKTIEVMLKSVPEEVAGIVFLSGGLSEEAASIYLSEMNNVVVDTPWTVSFSYGRALQHSCLKAWAGGNISAGQAALIARAQANSEASRGIYVPNSQPSSDEKLFVAGYTY